MKTKSNGGLGTEDEYRELIMPLLNTRGHVCRVESPVVSPGIPDINFVDRVEGWESWIEIKWWDGKRFPEIRSTQVGWHRNRSRVAINNWILLGTWQNGHILIPGSAAESLKTLPNDIEHWLAMSYGYWEQDPMGTTKPIPIDMILERIHVEYINAHNKAIDREDARILTESQLP